MKNRLPTVMRSAQVRRSDLTRRPRRLPAALGILLALGLVTIPRGDAWATTIDDGSVTINAETTLQLACTTGCGGAPLAGTSAGQISGDDNGNSYTAMWPDPQAPPLDSSNLSGSLDYTLSCVEGVVIGGTIASTSQYVISGALLVYNGKVYRGATVTGTLMATWKGNALVASTPSLTITWSTSITINISVASASEGALTMQPLPPIGACASSSSQNYEIAGQVLTAVGHL